MKYNHQEHIRLLNYEHELEKQNKSLIKYDPIKYANLLKYRLIISEYFHWSQKNEYLELIKKFLNFEINGKEFDEKFSKMVTEIEKRSKPLPQNYEELRCVEPDPRSVGFGEGISEIYLCCNEFYEYYDLSKGENPALKTEEQLRDAVTNLLPEIQKYF